MKRKIYKEDSRKNWYYPTQLKTLQYVRHPLVYLVEAADDICYQIMDIEDSHKAKILSYDGETTGYCLISTTKIQTKEDLKTISRTFKICHGQKRMYRIFYVQVL